jgi:hypothetical protein
MTSGDLLKLFRSEMSDDIAPYLWSDADVYGYIDDAQKMFCRKTDGIPDATTAEVTAISVAPNTTWVDTHPSIRKYRTATRRDTGRPVEIVNQEDLPSRGWFYDGKAGPVRALVIGEEGDKARVYPKSSETMTIDILVYRLPLEDIESDQDFEIGTAHHRHLLLWVKALAYLKQDSETFDKSRSKEFEDKFLVYCIEAMLEARKQKHKTRVVQYGGV